MGFDHYPFVVSPVDVHLDQAGVDEYAVVVVKLVEVKGFLLLAQVGEQLNDDTDGVLVVVVAPALHRLEDLERDLVLLLLHQSVD